MYLVSIGVPQAGQLLTNKNKYNNLRKNVFITSKTQLTVRWAKLVR